MGNSLGEFIKRRRKELGLSQRGLAKKARISHTAIYRLEGGEVTPETNTVESIASALGVPLKDLMDSLQGKMPAPDEDPRLSMLFAQIKQLPPSQRTLLEDLVEVLLRHEQANSPK